MLRRWVAPHGGALICSDVCRDGPGEFQQSGIRGLARSGRPGLPRALDALLARGSRSRSVADPSAIPAPLRRENETTLIPRGETSRPTPIQLTRHGIRQGAVGACQPAVAMQRTARPLQSFARAAMEHR